MGNKQDNPREDKRADEFDDNVRAGFELLKLEYVATQFQSRADKIMEELGSYSILISGYELDEEALKAERQNFQETQA